MVYKSIIPDNKNKKGKSDSDQVAAEQNYKFECFKKKLGVVHQEVTDAIKATGSNDRKTLEKYLEDKHSK